MDKVIPDYEYIETPDKTTPPDGDGWEYWSDRTTPDEHVAVWRRVRQEPQNDE